MTEYRNQPTEFAQPTDAELRARGKRNVAIALGLLGFMGVVFLAMLARGGYLG